MVLWTNIIQLKIFTGYKFSQFSQTDLLPPKYTPQKNNQDGDWWCHYVHMSVWTSSKYPCEWDGSLQSVCPQNSHCRDQRISLLLYKRIRKRYSEVVKVEISSAEFFCSTRQFLPHDSSPDAFVILRASTHKRKTSPLLHKLASLLHCSVSLIQLTHGVWSGHHVVIPRK